MYKKSFLFVFVASVSVSYGMHKAMLPYPGNNPGFWENNIAACIADDPQTFLNLMCSCKALIEPTKRAVKTYSRNNPFTFVITPKGVFGKNGPHARKKSKTAKKIQQLVEQCIWVYSNIILRAKEKKFFNALVRCKNRDQFLCLRIEHPSLHRYTSFAPNNRLEKLKDLINLKALVLKQQTLNQTRKNSSLPVLIYLGIKNLTICNCCHISNMFTSKSPLQNSSLRSISIENQIISNKTLQNIIIMFPDLKTLDVANDNRSVIEPTQAFEDSNIKEITLRYEHPQGDYLQGEHLGANVSMIISYLPNLKSLMVILPTPQHDTFTIPYNVTKGRHTRIENVHFWHI